ncbi:MAG: mechanosensitive ion channel family protein [Chloroflexi bacterium]|nr:mechanosensitive ion channel family protein [Chloroflexota bacterium]
MNPTPEQTEQLTSWLSRNWLTVVIIAVVLFLVWRFARPFVHRGVMGLLSAQERAMPTGVPHEELAKRAATLEDLVNRLIRLLAVLAVIFVIFGLFDLWSAIAGLGLILAALTVAGQSIILDYIMGLLIIVEGQYFKGDTISVGGIEGEVEEVGLRRTVLRDTQGTVHSISNGTIRVSSNLTRIYAVAFVDVEGVRNRDVEAVIAIMGRVGQEMATDPAWSPLIEEAPHYRSTPAFTDLGVTLRMSTKVRTAGRWSVPAEIRRRMALALSAAGIHLNRRAGTPGIQTRVEDDDGDADGGASR